MDITAQSLASRYVGIRELSKQGQDHPLIQWWLSLCGLSIETPDEVPWCSAFVNGIAWELGLPRSHSAAARSWLTIGTSVPIEDAKVGFDIVVLWRDRIDAATGHVALYAGRAAALPAADVVLLGGNQNNGVCTESFALARVLAVRRLLA